MRLIDAYEANMKLVELYNQENNPAAKAALRAAMQVITNAPTTPSPPNNPLTLDELREMDGEPVWIVSLDGRNEPCWMLVDVRYELCREAHGGMAVFENNGKTWLAYRRRPEGGDSNA